MRIETDRLIIRSVERGDEMVYADMAKDGSLLDVGFDINCAEWIGDWIGQALQMDEADNLQNDYIAYTIRLRSNGMIIGAVGCSYEKVSFQLVERKMYQDINDAKEELYRFYEITA